MSNKAKKSPTVSSRNDPTKESTRLLTRAEVAELLRCSVSSVRRLEGSSLNPVVGDDLVHRFDPLEVIRLAHERAQQPVEASKEGERDARVFEMLACGKGLREIVVTLRLPAEVAQRLMALWESVGRRDFIIPRALRGQLEDSLGPLSDAAELVRSVQRLVEELDRLRDETDRRWNRTVDIVSAVGLVVAQHPDLLKALVGITRDDPEMSAVLERAVELATPTTP